VEFYSLSYRPGLRSLRGRLAMLHVRGAIVYLKVRGLRRGACGILVRGLKDEVPRSWKIVAKYWHKRCLRFNAVTNFLQLQIAELRWKRARAPSLLRVGIQSKTVARIFCSVGGLTFPFFFLFPSYISFSLSLSPSFSPSLPLKAGPLKSNEGINCNCMQFGKRERQN